MPRSHVLRAVRRLWASDRLVIGPGSAESDVRSVQSSLRDTWAPDLKVDGEYGSVTRAAVALAQKRMNAPITGLADAVFVQALRSEARAARAEGRMTRLEERLRRIEGVNPAVAAPWRPGTPELWVQVVMPAVNGKPQARLTVEAPATSFVARRLAEGGLADYEPATLATFLALATTTDGTILDVGANIGIYSLLAAVYCPERTVMAFEPTPELAAICRYLAFVNGLAVDVREVALADRSGTAKFYLSASTDASNSLREGFRSSRGTLDVRVETLDEVLGGTVPSALSLIKLDTEATEPAVLRGARDVIAATRPWIICEVLAGRTEQELERFLSEHDYRAYHLTDAVVIRETRPVVGDASYRHMNWLFAPEPPPEILWESRASWRRALEASRVTRG